MAIQISGTNVITNARQLANILTLDGPTARVVQAALDFDMWTNLFTASTGGTWVVPTGVSRILYVIGGGGGGGGVTSANGAIRPGQNGEIVFAIATVTPGASLAYTIGAGGAGSTPNPSVGNAGGNSTFNGATALGGLGGTTGLAVNSGMGTIKPLSDASQLFWQRQYYNLSVAETHYDNTWATGVQSVTAAAAWAIGTNTMSSGGASGIWTTTTTNDGSVNTVTNTDGKGGIGGGFMVFWGV